MDVLMNEVTTTKKTRIHHGKGTNSIKGSRKFSGHLAFYYCPFQRLSLSLATWSSSTSAFMYAEP